MSFSSLVDGSGAFVVGEDSKFAAQWEYLHAVLASLRRPAVLDRRGHRPDPRREVVPPRPGDCLVFLEIPESQWAKSIAASRVLACGSVVWSLCPGWLERVGSRLFCHRGIWADKGGQLYLDDFSPPREVTYFVNLYSAADTYDVRNDGNDFEHGLACPASSTQEISSFVACKVTTRLLAARGGVAVPRSIAFLLRRELAISVSSATLERAGCALVPLAPDEDRDGLLARIRAALAAEIHRWPAHVRRVVVKPSGLLHMQCRGVSLHDRADLDAIAVAVVDLVLGAGSVRLQPDDSVLVDAFAGGQRRTMRIRAIVARTGESLDDASVQAMVAGIGDSDAPISGGTTWPHSIADALANYGVPRPTAEARRLEAVIRSYAAAVLAGIAAQEPWSADKRGGRSDLLGLDFVLALPGDTQGDERPLLPVLIEVNNHDCASVTIVAGFTAIDHRAPGIESPDAGVLDEYFRAIAARSQRYRLAGRTVLVIGGVTTSKRSVWRSARDSGVRVTLANDRPITPEDGLGPELRAEIIVPGLHRDHSLAGDEAIADGIVAELQRRDLHIDGAVTFWEDCTVLAAMVVARLGSRGNPVAAQRTAKDKLATSRALSATLPFAVDSFEPAPATLVPPFVELSSPADVDDEAARKLPFPAVLRFRYGSSAVGTRVVLDRDEARAEAQRLVAIVRDADAADAHYGGCGFRFGDGAASLLLSGFVEGTEHDVDLLLFDGELVDAWVTDNGDTDLPMCAETLVVAPSRLSASRQQQLISAAWQACRRVGLMNGAACLDMKLSPTGPKVIEINGRMGGYNIPDWVRRVWGFDLAAACYQIACGIRPIGRVRRAPLTALAGVYTYPGDGARPEAVSAADLVRVPLSGGAPGAEYREPMESIGWAAATPDEAVARMIDGLGELYAERPDRAATLRRYASRLPRDD